MILHQSIFTLHSTEILVTVPGNITPIIVTLLSVQSKLSFTLCPQTAHRPNVFTVHFFTTQTHATVYNWARIESSGDDDHFLRGVGHGQLLASDIGWGFRPHHPGTGERPMLVTRHQAAAPHTRLSTGRSSLYSSLYLGQSRAIPGHGDMTHDTGPTWIQTPGVNTETYSAPPPTQ